VLTDIVGSTQQARRLGDRRWRELLTVHDELARRLIDQAGGRLVNTTGDGIMATFDGPGRGIHCAIALGDQLRGIDVRIRAGLHVGEVERRDDDVGGMAVHIAARVMAAAQHDEMLAPGPSATWSLASTSSWTTAERGRSRASRATGSCPRCTGPATLPTAERFSRQLAFQVAATPRLRWTGGGDGRWPRRRADPAGPSSEAKDSGLGEGGLR